MSGVFGLSVIIWMKILEHLVHRMLHKLNGQNGFAQTFDLCIKTLETIIARYVKSYP